MTLDPADVKRLRVLLDDVIHAAHVAGEPARDWNARACAVGGVAKLSDLTETDAIRVVEALRAEHARLLAVQGPR